MNPNKKFKPVVAQLKTGVSAQSIKRPVAPPVYKPQPPQRFVQRKIAVPPPFTAVAVRSAIQLAAGKGGEDYSTPDKDMTPELREEAMERAKLKKGIKGHGFGDAGSKWSRQSQDESARYHQAKREIRAEKKVEARNCRDYHKKKFIGDDCPSCGQEITKAMCK